MKKMLMSLTLAVLCTVGANAQKSGDWYIGTGDIANVAWTEWSIAPTVGYGITDKLMVGLNVSQADSTVELVLDAHVRYFYKGYFAYASAPNLDTDRISLGLGKMFTFHRGIFVDPKVVYDTKEKTTNLMLGVGLKF
jgi:hypothetical protein|tara:strand:+ start:421 stop:831 length:411 start_codon:yes stop_codon:yes gene_type:complete